jgi:hypothetical protein
LSWANAAPPADWVRECPGSAFCFSRPSTLAAQPGQAIDSLVGRYRNDKLSLSFDMGRYGTSLEHLSQPTQQAMTIDGRPATVYRSGSDLLLVIPKVHDMGTVTVKFSMSLRFEGKAELALARQIFQSIEFKPPPK